MNVLRALFVVASLRQRGSRSSLNFEVRTSVGNKNLTMTRNRRGQPQAREVGRVEGSDENVWSRGVVQSEPSPCHHVLPSTPSDIVGFASLETRTTVLNLEIVDTKGLIGVC